MSIGEGREKKGLKMKCSRLVTTVNTLIDQLHHCVVGSC